MLWNTDQQLIFYQMKFCLKWLLRRKIREGGATGAGRPACAVTRLSRICLSKTFSLLSSASLFMELQSEFCSKPSALCYKLQIKPCILEHFLFSHIGHPYWCQQIYAKAKKRSFCSSVLVEAWLMTVESGPSRKSLREWMLATET